MKLTYKLLAEASAVMLAEFNARADKTARKLGLHNRAWHDMRTPEAKTAKRQRIKFAAACAIGESYHDHIGALYTSQRASVIYGHGGTKQTDWHAYSKSYKYPANWQDAGARIESRTLIIETSRGTEKARLPMPAVNALLVTHSDALTHGDLFGRRRAGGNIVDRFNVHGKPIGIAVEFPDIFNPTVQYWEHGNSIADCEVARQEKITHAAAKAAAARETKKESRRLRLLARISTAVLVTRADGRAIGACQAGIDGWCSRMNITTDALPARDVVRLATQSGERQALAAALHACRKALIQQVQS